MADLFELSKLEAKQISPQKEKFQIFELLQDMSNSFRILAQEKNITLHTNCIAEAPMVNADLQMIERVIQNLVYNAINYTPENGEINIDCCEKDGRVEVKISNSGEGIKPEDLPKIFERYYKTDDTAINSGTGLGLAIVKNILILHDSDITVESQVGKATAFKFSLN
jgi:signal transduction histidine kinase